MGDIIYAMQEHTFLTVLILTLIPTLFLMIYEYLNFKHNQMNKQIRKLFVESQYQSKSEQYITQFEKTLSSKTNIIDKIQTKIEKAEIKLSVREYVTIMFFLIIGGGLVGFFITPFMGIFDVFYQWIDNLWLRLLFIKTTAAIAFAGLGYYLPNLWVKFLINKKQELLSEQIEDFLISFSENIASGMNNKDALKEAGESLRYPMKDEINKTYDEIQAGSSFVDALEHLKKRVDLEDLKVAISSIQIQQNTGGKLANMLKTMVGIIGERKILKKEIKKTTASSRMTAYVLLIGPLGFIGIITSMNPESYLALFSSIPGIIIIIAGAGSYALGAFWVFKIIRSINKISI